MQEIKFKKSRWINLVQPCSEDLAKLAKKYRFHELDLEDCLQKTERPKIDEYDKYLFIILQFPVYSSKYLRFDTEQLNMFIGQDYLITIHNGELKALNEMADACQQSLKSRRLLFGEKPGTGYLLYEIISVLFDAIFPVTDKIQASLKKIEDEIFESKRAKDELFNIMILKKNVITLRKILLPQRSVVATLEHKQKRFLPEDLVIYFDDIVDQIESLWNILGTQKEIIESLEDTNESLLSHNINLTMRTLTVFSAIMLPLTFLTGLFGMNVQLPFTDAHLHVEHFWTIIIIMGIVGIVLFTTFKWKNWL
ncbi:magnesium transporter CorA family protein [Patescibacteria group bacterium]|nr:magnesium transporter CorA family protein [Patescibacteria group bacterium]MBU1016293.1 magnesium transporter CorA family protein [Patescibacteria group bacterium]MBU1685569.1 magnesium transporter CorA family protein [Patescibacteria group bacterium]MBU1938494.1 magnesium transporter CorA family protein [Patescibacteria group bacterium]